MIDGMFFFSATQVGPMSLPRTVVINNLQIYSEKIQLSCQVFHAATLVQVRLTAASMGPKGALSATGKDRCLHHAAVCFLMVSGAL
jgi:hypothetical protein